MSNNEIQSHSGATDSEKQVTYYQPEFEEIVGEIDEKAAKKRHLEAIRDRWFRYYKAHPQNDDARRTIISQYNKIALMGNGGR